MTVIYLTEYKTNCWGVTFQHNGWVKIQDFKEISKDENNILYIRLLQTFLGKSKECDMTLLSGALEKSVFDENTILFEIGEEWGRHRFTYIGGNLVCSFLTNDDIYDYISNMGNNLTLYIMAIGEENIYFLTPHFKFIKRCRVVDNELLSTNEESADPFD